MAYNNGDKQADMAEIERTLSFGYWLRRRRKALDLTQEELARRVGCAVDTIKKIEADARRPSKQLAELLANELEIAPQERTSFIQAARAERSSERLTLPREPVRVTGERGELPAFLAAPAQELPQERTRFVSRRRELAALNQHLHAALEGNGQVVLITGEAGRGKSALMAEFARRAQEAHPDLIVASGNCNAFAGVGDPYLPFRDVMTMLSGDVQSKWVAGAIRQEQARRLWMLIPDMVRALVEQGPDLLDIFVSGEGLLRQAGTTGLERSWRERLGTLVERERRGEMLTAPAAQTHLFDQYSNVLRTLSAEHPLVLLLDDLQWADDASINLLFHLGRRLAGSRLLLVGAYRESDVALGRPGNAEERAHPIKPVVHELIRTYGDIRIDLSRVTTAEGREFVEALLDAEPNELGEEFRAAMFEHTQGHPLFSVELLRDMQVRGDLFRDAEGRWVQGAALDWNALPARVEAVIAQRIERLDEGLRELLTVASVEGEGFSAQVAARVLNRDEWQVLRELSQELRLRHHLILDRDEVTAGQQRLSRYQFRHVLFQQYLYHRLGAGERRIMHGKVARALEALYAERLDEVTAQLAHHYAEAGDGEKAVNYLLNAGDRARTLYAHREAIDHYRRALRFLQEMGDDERAARTLMKLGLTYNLAFDFERARQAYDEGFVLWQRVETNRRLASPPHSLRGTIEPDARTLRTNWRDPDTLDPAHPLTIWTVSMVGHFFSGLVTITPEMDVAPDVARSWDVLEGGKKYIFHLRQDVRWSDGTAVTAGDFEYAWKRVLDPATGAMFAAILLHDIRGARSYHRGETTDADSIGVRAINDTTLEVELEVPAAYFIQLLAYPTTYPVPRRAVEAHGKAWTEPRYIVTNGPFRLVAWEHHRKMVLERNPAYHGAWGNMQRMELILEDDPADLLSLYEEDGLDMLHLWFLPPATMDRARQYHAGDYVSGPQLLTYYFAFHVTRPPFDDVRVRRAFALAVDKDRLANVDMRGNFYPATGGFVPPGMPGHAPGIAPRRDAAEARRLLAEAGFPGGRGFPTIEILTRTGREYLCEPLMAQWRETLGVEMTVEGVSSPELEERLGKQMPDLFLHLWVADYPDPDCYLRVCMQDDQPTFGWHNARYEGLIEEARRLTDQAERMRLYRQAEEILIEEMPILPTAYGRVHVLLKPWVRNYCLAMMKQQFWKEIVIEAKAEWTMDNGQWTNEKREARGEK